MDEAAKEARRQYHREYAKNNRKRLNEAQNRWRQANPEKVREYDERYWKRKAEARNKEQHRGENMIVADFLLFVIVCELAAIYDNQKNAECGKEQ